jgi:acyl-CoA thioesterase-1
MKRYSAIRILLFLLVSSTYTHAQVSDAATYLDNIKNELNAVWPKSRRINLVFHGHSVPSGFWDKHEVHTLESYPHLVLQALKEKYPYAGINIIITAIGGEGSISGQKRFENDVLIYKPDVLFIDYALNDRFAPLEKTKEALEKMIIAAQAKNIKVMMLTPSPDQRIDISDPSNPLDPYVAQIRSLASQYKTGLADPYTLFQEIIKQGRLKEHMASVNHPNLPGHQVIAGTIIKWF